MRRRLRPHVSVLAGLVLGAPLANAQGDPIASTERASETCARATAKQDLGALDPVWSDALRELVDATGEADKPWGCTGANLVLEMHGDSATLVVERVDRAPMSRHVAAPEDVVVMGKAMLARALPPAPASEPTPDVPAAPAPEAQPADSATEPEAPPRAFARVTGVARYMGVSGAVVLGGAARGTIPFGDWYADLGVRYVTLGADVGNRTAAQEFDMSELGISLGLGYSLLTNPLYLRVGLFGALAVVDMDLDQQVDTGEFEVESGAVDGRIGTALRMSVPMVGPLHLALGIDAEIAPASLVESNRRIDPLLPPLPGYTIGADFGLELAIP